MDATDHFNRGLNHYDENQFDEALREFTSAILLSPDFPDPYTGRGFLYSLMGDYQQAEVNFSDAIRLNPADADAWKGRADARQIRGKLPESITDYNAAIQLISDDAEFFHRRGDAHSRNGNIQQAIEDYRQSIRLEPDNPISHYYLAQSLFRTEAFAEAIQVYEVACRGDSNLDTEVFAFNAWLLATCPETQLRNPSKAIELANTACEQTDWSEEQQLGILAAAHAANGDFASAVHWQAKAIESADHDRKQLQQSRLEAYNKKQPCPYSEVP